MIHQFHIHLIFAQDEHFHVPIVEDQHLDCLVVGRLDRLYLPNTRLNEYHQQPALRAALEVQLGQEHQQRNQYGRDQRQAVVGHRADRLGPVLNQGGHVAVLVEAGDLRPDDAVQGRPVIVGRAESAAGPCAASGYGDTSSRSRSAS